jgi:hypothetical protein
MIKQSVEEIALDLCYINRNADLMHYKKCGECANLIKTLNAYGNQRIREAADTVAATVIIESGSMSDDYGDAQSTLDSAEIEVLKLIRK